MLLDSAHRTGEFGLSAGKKLEPRGKPDCAIVRKGNSDRVIVGAISDTHGLLRDEALEALRAANYILHAGDIGDPDILDELRQLAPVTAVRGNVDTEEWARKLPLTEVIEVAGVSIYLLHNLDELDLKPEAAGFRAVVYGHSHQPKIEEKNGVLYFNPGSAGPRRFTLPVSVGRLVIEDGRVRAELTELKVASRQ